MGDCTYSFPPDLNDVIESWYSIVRRRVYPLLCDADAANEAVQRAALKFLEWVAAGAIADPRDHLGLFLTMGVRAALDILRERQRDLNRDWSPVENEGNEQIDWIASPGNPEDRLLGRRLAAQGIRQFFRELPDYPLVRAIHELAREENVRPGTERYVYFTRLLWSIKRAERQTRLEVLARRLGKTPNALSGAMFRLRGKWVALEKEVWGCPASACPRWPLILDTLAHPMLVSLVAELESTAAGFVPATMGEHIQSELFARLARIDRVAATEIHGPAASGRRRPYRISPLFLDLALLEGRRFRLQPGTRCWFRITGLNLTTSQLFLALSQQTRDWRIASTASEPEPFEAHFRVRRWCVRPGDHHWAALITPEDLGEAAWRAVDSDEGSRIQMRFETPTAFELRGEWGNWMTFPLPRLVFESLRNDAAAFCNVGGIMPRKAPLIDGNIAIGTYRLETRMMYFQRRHRGRAGFTGFCDFLLNPALPHAERVWLQFLAGLSFYAGVGAAGAWGMGQARREPAARFEYRGLHPGRRQAAAIAGPET